MNKAKLFMISALTAVLLISFAGCTSTPPADDLADDTTSETGNPESEIPIETDEITTSADPDAPLRLSFLAAGDNIIHEAIFLDAKKRASGNDEYDFEPMYEGVAELIKSADISFVNQETVMGGVKYGIFGYPNFNSPQEAGDALVNLGFDIVNVANNHMLDRREDCLLDTVKYWETKPVLLLGAYNKSDYDNIRVLERDGLKIAFLSYTYGTNGMTLPAGSDTVIPLIVDADILRQMELAKQAGDLVFVSIHWGTDGSATVTQEQRRVAQMLADAGADVIIGHHSHTVQEMKWVENKNGHKTLLIYSLGNLISTMNHGANMVGGFMTFDIVKESDGEPFVENARFIPIVTHYSMNRDGLQVYQLENYTAELAAKHGAQLWGAFSLGDMKKWVTNAIPSEFLPEFFR